MSIKTHECPLKHLDIHLDVCIFVYRPSDLGDYVHGKSWCTAATKIVLTAVVINARFLG